MIAQLTGIVMAKNPSSIVINIGGVGLRIEAPLSALAEARLEHELTLATHLVVRENELSLYGFLTEEERSFFEMLIEVSGVGPKSALAILNLASTEDLTNAIAAGDTTYLTRVSGIGHKSAAKIVLELKEKLSEHASEGGVLNLKEESDTLEALTSLGYSRKEAREALRNVSKETQGTNERIKEALKRLG